MLYDEARRNEIYEKTNGRCHLCWKRLSWNNYGRPGRRGAWEIDHSRSRSAGGGNRLQNLFPACKACNQSKGAGSNRVIRKRYGRSRAPMSAGKRQEARIQNAMIGGACGIGLSLLLRIQPGPLALLGAVVCAIGDPEG